MWKQFYHQASPSRDIDNFAHDMLFSLKLPPIKGTYFEKIQELGA